MSFERWQEWWREQPAESVPSAPDLAATIAQVRTRAQAFERMIFWRDVREVLAGVAVAVVFGWMALGATREGAPAWPLWLAAACPFAMITFLLGRRRHVARQRPPSDGTVLAELARARADVREQIWLLERVRWWYLLPCGASVAGVLLQLLLYAPLPLAARAAALVLMLLAGGFVGAVVDALNRRAVHLALRPRLAELEREWRYFAGAED